MLRSDIPNSYSKTMIPVSDTLHSPSLFIYQAEEIPLYQMQSKQSQLLVEDLTHPCHFHVVARSA